MLQNNIFIKNVIWYGYAKNHNNKTKKEFEEIKRFANILTQMEDNADCEKLKEWIDNDLHKALYNSEEKEGEISYEGKFINLEDIDIIITTSCIQSY